MVLYDNNVQYVLLLEALREMATAPLGGVVEAPFLVLSDVIIPCFGGLGSVTKTSYLVPGKCYGPTNSYEYQYLNETEVS